MKKGFTLLELLIVVVIIGILATFAIPQFLRATERAKLGKAQNSVSLIAQGLNMYYADMGDWPGSLEDIDEYVEISAQTDADPDWTYSFSTAADGTYTVTATRDSGTYSGQTITLNQDNVWSGTHELRRED